MKLITDTDLADILGIEPIDVRRACMNKGWPHVRPKRSAWRFTQAQVDQIIAMQSNAGKKPAKSGLTKGSRARS
jgi:hypothetical protein